MLLPKLLEFINLDDVWRFKFPATLVFFAEEDDLPSELMSRPNTQFIKEFPWELYKHTEEFMLVRLAFELQLKSFVTFKKRWNATTSDFVFPLSHQVYLPPTDTAEMFGILCLTPNAECVPQVAHRPPSGARTSLQLHE